MKNLKNTIAAIGLATVLGMGATTAKAGILISDKTGNMTENAECSTAREETLTSKIKGIIVVGIAGLIMSDELIMSDGLVNTGSQCQDDSTKDGILISG